MSPRPPLLAPLLDGRALVPLDPSGRVVLDVQEVGPLVVYFVRVDDELVGEVEQGGRFVRAD